MVKVKPIRFGSSFIPVQPSVSDSNVLTPDDEIISDPDADRPTTRKILRSASFPENRKDATARVNVTLTHQRRGNADAQADAPWIDVEAAKLSEIHKDEKVSFPLSGRETKRLFLALI